MRGGTTGTGPGMGTSNHGSDGYVTQGSFDRDTDYITTRITADGRDGYPVEPGRYRLVVSRACPWANRAIIVRRLLGLEDALLDGGLPGRRTTQRSWTFDLDPGGRRPGARHRAAPGRVLRALPRLRRGASPCRRSSTSRPARWSPTTTPQITLDLSHAVARAPPRRRARPLPRGAPAGRDRRGERGGLHRRQQRRLPVRLRRLPGGVRRRRTTGSSTALDWLSSSGWRPALPGRRHHHRGRRPAVHHAGPLRRGLPRPLQVQPARS